MPRLAPFVLAAALFANLAHAQDVRVFRASDAVDPAEVARILGGGGAGPTEAGSADDGAPKLRSLRLLHQTPAPVQAGNWHPRPQVAAPEAVESPVVTAAAESTKSDAQPAPKQSPAAPAPAPAPSALSLPVQFAFDSADILPGARVQLDALAAGIKLLPAGTGVIIEGHTDAIGGDRYNIELSERRAAAVKRYLVLAHSIDPARLNTVGFGKFRPLDRDNPAAAENRRVQFRGV